MSIVVIWHYESNDKAYNEATGATKLTQCSPKVSPCDAIFFSILAVNIANYGSLPKTLNLTPPKLMRNAG